MSYIQAHFTPAEAAGERRSVAEATWRNSLWKVFRDLREAKDRYGLAAQPFATLQALVGALKPEGGAIVFLSNAELSRRTNYLAERTVRRHIQALVTAGIVTRRDSPNRKRYRCRNPQTAGQLAFGIDLRPFLERAEEFRAAAEEAVAERAQVRFLRAQLRVLAGALERDGRYPSFVDECRRIVRRKTSSVELRHFLDQAPCPLPEDAEPELLGSSRTSLLTARDGSSVRHHQKSDEEEIDGNRPCLSEDKGRNASRIIMRSAEGASLATILAACPTALTFAERVPRSLQELEALSDRLAGWIGIDRSLLSAAREAVGPQRTAKTVLAMTEMLSSLRSPAAYFQSVTIGRRSASYSPDRFLKRLSRRAIRS